MSTEWLAGLLEGEGSFQVQKNVLPRKDGTFNRNVYPRVEVGMCDEDVVRKVAEVAGYGNVTGPYHYGQEKWSPYWKWSISGPRAAEVMERVFPLMGKRRSADIQTALAAHAVSLSARQEREDEIANRRCSQDGCEAKFRCKGLCSAHYQRWVKCGRPMEWRAA